MSDQTQNTLPVEEKDSGLKEPSAVATSAGQNHRDPIVDAVRAKLLQRSERGLTKYGVTVAKADLTQREWLQHAQEEALDLAVYLERILTLISKS